MYLDYFRWYIVILLDYVNIKKCEFKQALNRKISQSLYIAFVIF